MSGIGAFNKKSNKMNNFTYSNLDISFNHSLNGKIKEVFMYRSYIFTVIGALGIMLAACFFTGLSVKYFLNLITFGIIILIPVILSLSSYSPAEIKESFSIAFQKKENTKSRYEKALNYFKALNKYLAGAAVIGILIAFVAVLTNYEDKKNFGLGLSVSLLIILYAAVLIILIVVPFTTALRKKLAESEK